MATPTKDKETTAMNLHYNEERLGLICECDQMHVMDCFGEAVNVPWYLPESYYQQVDA